MRYSEIVGAKFYNIGLSPEQAEMVDVFFSSAAHHFLILPFCRNGVHHSFHLRRHRAHLNAMMTLVFECGDISEARDESLRGLGLHENWNPQVNRALPDPRMFDSMGLDLSLAPGEALPFDFYIPIVSVAGEYRLVN